MNRRFASGLVSTLAATVILQALGLVSGVLLARVLGPEGRGELASVVLWPSILVYLGDLGGPNAYAFLSAKSRKLSSALLGNLLPLVVSQTAVLVLVGIPAIWLLTIDVPHLRSLTIFYMFAYVPLNLATRYLSSLSQGLGNFRCFNAVRISVQAVYVSGVLLLWMFSSASVESVLIVTLLGNVGALGIAYHGVRSFMFSTWLPDRGLAVQTLSYGWKSHLGNLTPVDAMRLDVAFVALLLRPYELGLYTIASSAANIIRAAGSSVAMVALPSVANAPSPENQVRVTHRMLSLTLLLTGTLCAGLMITADWSLPFVYGGEFEAAASISQVLALGMLPATLRQVLGACLRGAGDPSAASKAEVLSWLVLAAGLPMLFPAYGAIGVAMAVTCSYFVAFGASYWLGSRTLALSLPEILPKRSDLRQMGGVVKSIRQRRGGKTCQS